MPRDKSSPASAACDSGCAVRQFRLCVGLVAIAALWGVGHGCVAVDMAGGGGDTIFISSTCSDEFTTTELAAQAVALANAERLMVGAGELVVDPVLTAVAEDYARTQAIQDFMGHVSPDGSTVMDRVLNAGYDPVAVAENLAYGHCTAEHAMSSWMDSEGHRTNLLNPTYTDTGVGVYRGGEWEIYWVQVFAARW